MKPVIPHLWFDKEAKEAAAFYVSAFPNSKITSVAALRGVPTPSGDCDIVSFELSGVPFMAISAGPLFKFNPSISFLVTFKSRKPLDALWVKLSEGGAALMPLDKYPFSEHYGWTTDRYGLSWQLMLAGPQDKPRPPIVPSLLFSGPNSRAQEASDFYVSLGLPEFHVIDSPTPHAFTFNEAVSLLIPCETQKEIDAYSSSLAADPSAGQCGWLHDKFGVSWQVWPTVMGEMMSKGTPEQVKRLTKAFLPMKKFDIAALEKAFNG